MLNAVKSLLLYGVVPQSTRLNEIQLNDYELESLLKKSTQLFIQALRDLKNIDDIWSRINHQLSLESIKKLNISIWC